MAELSDDFGIFYQNLVDCGFDAATARQYATQLHAGDIPKTMPLLKQHRRQLLDALHTNQHRIDCLDYLLYTIERTRRN